MKGRKPLPPKLKLLEGDRSKQGKKKLKEQGESFGADSPTPPPPSHLDEYALEEWNRRADVLNKLGFLNDIDTAAFAAYCYSYSVWRRATEEMNKLAQQNAIGGIVMKTKSGNVIQNVLLGIANRAADDMVRRATEMGLTPTSRARIGANFGNNKKQSKFDGLIGASK